MKKRFQQLANGNVYDQEQSYTITVEEIEEAKGEIRINTGPECSNGPFILDAKEFEKFPSSTDAGGDGVKSTIKEPKRAGKSSRKGKAKK